MSTPIASNASAAERETVPRRERILEAAVVEFGANGYSGARTAAIAARAGVNAQLITYYFGGKEGLLVALRDRWAAIEEDLVPDGASFAEAVAAYTDATLENADWARLLAWQALGDGPADGEGHHAAQAEQLRASLERTRARQRAGELRDDVGPELIVLLGHMLAFAPVLVPRIVAGILGEGEPWEGYRQRIVAQLPALIEARPASARR